MSTAKNTTTDRTAGSADDTLSPETRACLKAALNFTKVYKEHADDHVAVREALCLAEQYPALCRPIKPGDIFAGRRYYRPLAGFSAELNANQAYRALNDGPAFDWTDEDRWIREHLGISNSGFCHDHQAICELAAKYPEGSPERTAIEEMNAFWDEHSMRREYNRQLSDKVKNGLGKSTGFDTCHLSGFIRQDCYSLDYDKLLQNGIPGMRVMINDAAAAGGDADLYKGMQLALDVLVNVCRYYRDMALAMRDEAAAFEEKERLRLMADTLEFITEHRPENLRQAMQLFWMYNLVSDSPNYGRMDQYLGDFYCHDIDSGLLAEDEALELICGIWQLISEVMGEGGPTRPNARLVVGGKGRRNEENADRFALAAMDASLKMRVNEPNLTLRFYNGQNRALMDRALDLIGEGCIHPGLYNDDEHIPMVRDWFNVPEKDAEQYLPEGCGELLIDHRGFGSPNNIHIFPSALDLVLHNGYDRVHGEQRGVEVGTLDAFDTFDTLLAAFKKQVDHNNAVLAERHAMEHRVEAKMGAFLFMSMLSDDCITRGKSLFNGGVRYLGGIIETFGLTSTADSLTAIKELVYDKKVMTLEHLVAALDADFKGYEKEHMLMLGCPKFGNDDDVADTMHTELSSFVCKSAHRAGQEHGLHFFLNCNLNPGGIYYATHTPASADGRMYGQSMALGNAPTPGQDKNSVTALLNSMAKHEKCHAGYVQNLKVNKSMFTPENRPRFEALLDTYFNNGGLQLMVTALNKDDLENALKEPEKYRSLQVRVAGWTGTFVDLPSQYQQAILKRTMYS